MHAPIQTQLHIFSNAVHFLERHKLETGVMAAALLLVSVVLTFPPLALYELRVPSAQTHSVGVAMPPTYIENPQYTHEAEGRAHYINTHLGRLKTQTQADKVYVMSYRYARSRLGITIRISKTFEIGETGLTSPVEYYEGISRMNWLVMMRSTFQTANSPMFPVPMSRSYGMELYAPDGRAIGYLGVDYVQENPALSGETPDLLEQTATVIEAGFLQPIESLADLEGTTHSSVLPRFR